MAERSPSKSCPAVVKSPAYSWRWRAPTFVALLTATTLVQTLAGEQKPADAVAIQEANDHKPKADVDAEAWTADAFQLDDKAKREAAIESIRAAMASGNRYEAQAAASAFNRLEPIEFDKASFRPTVRVLLNS